MTTKVVPKFNTKSPWVWSYQFVEVDPATGAESPRMAFDYDDIQIVYGLSNGQEMGRASKSAGTLTITDATQRMVAVAVPVAGRPAMTFHGEVMLIADAYGLKSGHEPEWLGRDQATLVKGI